MFICMHISVACACNTHGDQKRVSRVSRSGVLDGCKLGTELGSSTRAAHAYNC